MWLQINAASGCNEKYPKSSASAISTAQLLRALNTSALAVWLYEAGNTVKVQKKVPILCEIQNVHLDLDLNAKQLRQLWEGGGGGKAEGVSESVILCDCQALLQTLKGQSFTAVDDSVLIKEDIQGGWVRLQAERIPSQVGIAGNRGAGELANNLESSA